MVKVDVPGQSAILLEIHPASTARGIALVVAVPGEVDAGPAVPLPVPAVHPPIDGYEAELTALALELDEGGPEEINRLLVPDVHLRDAPLAGNVGLGRGAYPRLQYISPQASRRP